MEAELITPEKEILQKLNELTGSNFREIKSNLTKISALFKKKMHVITIDPKLSPNTIQITYRRT